VTPALVLFAYALLLGLVAPVVLTRARWPQRAPGLGIAVWQSLTVSVLLALVLGGVALAVPGAPLTDGLAELLRACAVAIGDLYSSPEQTGIGLAGLLLALGVTGRCVYAAAATTLGTARQRRAHRDSLALLGRPSGLDGVVVVDHDTAAAYCLPGRTARVVLTARALVALPPAQLGAVLAHERAHLSHRHHWALGAADAAARAFPGVPLFKAARSNVARLVEMQADDSACHNHDRLDVAAALLTLGRGPVPAAALSATGGCAPDRVLRLLQPAHPLGRLAVGLGFAFSLSLSAAPVVVAVAPALSVAYHDLCPVSGRGAPPSS